MGNEKENGGETQPVMSSALRGPVHTRTWYNSCLFTQLHVQTPCLQWVHGPNYRICSTAGSCTSVQDRVYTI